MPYPATRVNLHRKLCVEWEQNTNGTHHNNSTITTLANYIPSRKPESGQNMLDRHGDSHEHPHLGIPATAKPAVSSRAAHVLSRGT